MTKTVAVVGDNYNQLPSTTHIWGESLEPIGGCSAPIITSLQSVMYINNNAVLVKGTTQITECLPCPVTLNESSSVTYINGIPICRDGDKEIGPHEFTGISATTQSTVYSD